MLGKYRDVILPFTALRRLDAVRESIIGSAVQPGAVDGPALCGMFNQVIAGAPTLTMTPLFKFHLWKANLRILDVSEIKIVPRMCHCRIRLLSE